jgi:hypothetical protein
LTKGNRGETTTIQQLAGQARARAIAHYGEARYAKMCLAFDQHLVPVGQCDEEGELGDMDEATSFALAVFKLLAHSPDPLTLQLGLIWLDGYGLGTMTLAMLGDLLAKIRAGAYL